MTVPIQNLHVQKTERLPTPEYLKNAFPANSEVIATVTRARTDIQHILQQSDPRMLIITGPCSIHDPASALQYADHLNQLRRELADQFCIVMRVYFEKPRTTVGWKGLIYDPHLDDSADIAQGLTTARQLLVQINSMGLPVATEFLDPIVPQYLADCISWAAIGARTTESQTHRQMASGLSMPVGFKNGTDGGLQVAIDAMGSAMARHNFLGIDNQGHTSIIRTTGNPWGHIVMRGGHKRTNYDPESIAEALRRLKENSLNPVVMVDCSHANSEKIPARQEDVWTSVIDQRVNGCCGLIGLMLESHLHEGSQKIPANPAAMKYGVSITDACIDWPTTDRILRQGAATLRDH